MPRQNFISKDFFVRASEKEVKKVIMGIPEFAHHIKFVQENKLVDSIRFCYQRPNNKIHNLDVSLLPLDDQFTSVSLHASHSNGQSFYSDPELSAAIHDFELAIEAGLKGGVTNYVPFVAKKPMTQKFMQLSLLFISSISLFFLKKKLS